MPVDPLSALTACRTRKFQKGAPPNGVPWQLIALTLAPIGRAWQLPAISQSAKRRGMNMQRRMSSMTHMEIAKIIAERKPVILPPRATESHRPHMPTHTHTHQAV